MTPPSAHPLVGALAIRACMGYVKKAEKIGKVVMRRVTNKHRKQNL